MELRSKKQATAFFVIGFVLAWVLCSFTFSVYHEDLWKSYVTKTISNASRTVPVVAVNKDGIGIVGSMTVKAIWGEGDVLINTNPFVETDLQDSAIIAMQVAREATGISAPYNDFVINFKAPSKSVGGPSAGAAMTIAAMALLQNRTIRNDVALTGTIRPDAKIGRVGRIIEKTLAASEAGYKIMIVPEYQSVLTTIEKGKKEGTAGTGFYLNNTYYEIHTLNITEQAKEWEIDVVEASNIMEVAETILE